jgi:small subunit ribosomal protein S19
MVREFNFAGKSVDELKKMDLKQFMELVPSRQRRSLKRDMLKLYAPLIKKVKAAKEGKRKKPIKTHARDCIIIPDMIGLNILIHNGKEFKPLMVTEEMLGHYLGEFALTRSKVQHSAPGIGATKSSTAVASKAK